MVLESVKSQANGLILTGYLLLIVHYIYTVIGFNYWSEDYKAVRPLYLICQEKGAYCHNLNICFWSGFLTALN
jgi:hypothetical protein